MEKKIFNTDLGSLMGESPIDVDAVGAFEMDEFIPGPSTEEIEESKEKKEQERKAKEEEDANLIDLEELDEEKEENNEEEKENKEKVPSSKNDKKPSSSPLTPYAKLLKDEGILPNLDLVAFDGSADGLKEAMIQEIVGAVDGYKESLPSRIKDLINNYEDGIPLEKLIALDREQIEVESISDDDLKEDVELQKKVVRNYLKKTTKFSDAKISKQIQFMEDSGELEDEAGSANTELKSILQSEKAEIAENAKKDRLAAQKRAKDELIELESKIKTLTEIIPGLPLNTKVKTSLYNSMTVPAGQDRNGNPVNKIVAARMEDPMGFEIKLHYLFEITKGFTDFTKLADKGKKDAMREFEDVVNNLDKSDLDNGVSASEQARNNSNFLTAIGKTFNI